MKKLRILIMNHLGFSKTEANGVLIITLIVGLFWLSTRIYLHLQKPTEISESDSKEILAWKRDIENKIKKKENTGLQKRKSKSPNSKRPPRKINLTSFDPNLVDKNKLIDLGFLEFEANRIVNYRAAGGTFRSEKDLFKIYGIDSSFVSQAIAFVTIRSNDSGSIRKKDPVRLKSVVLNKVDLNKASAEELVKVRGIGKVLSGRIVKYRDALGGFHSPKQLAEVYGLKQEVITNLFQKFDLMDSVALLRINLNTDSASHLARHPYFSWNHANSIINYREQHGDFQNVTELKNIKIISDSLYQKIYPYLSLRP